MSKPFTEERVVHIILVVLVLLISSSGVGSAADTVHFAYKFEPGHSQKYKCEFGQEMDFFGTNYVILAEMEITEKCTEVLGDTLYKMEVAFDEISSSMRANDNLMPNNMDEALKGQIVSYSVNKLGEVTDIKTKSYVTGWSQIAQMVSGILEGCYPLLPDSSVEAGNKWEDNFVENPADMPSVEKKTKATYDFKEMKKEKGRKCAKVQGEMESTFSGEVVNNFGRFNKGGEEKVKFEFFFDPKGGYIVKFKASGREDSKMIEITDSSAKKPEEIETHLSFEWKKELK